MSGLKRDRVTGLVLLAIAIAWVAASIRAIPDGFSGSAYGPRAFPMWLGVLLAALSLIMVASSFRDERTGAEPVLSDETDEAGGVSARHELWAALATFGFLVLMLGSMTVFGFLLSTVVLVALFVWFVLGGRSVPVTALLSIGLGVGIWYAMSRFLNVYLPAGIWGI